MSTFATQPKLSHADLLASSKGRLSLLLARARRFLIEEDEYSDLLDLISFYRPVWISENGNRHVNILNRGGTLVVTEIVGGEAVLSHYSVPLVLSLRERCIELALILGCTRSMTLNSDANMEV